MRWGKHSDEKDLVIKLVKELTSCHLGFTDNLLTVIDELHMKPRDKLGVFLYLFRIVDGKVYTTKYAEVETLSDNFYREWYKISSDVPLKFIKYAFKLADFLAQRKTKNTEAKQAVVFERDILLNAYMERKSIGLLIE